MSMLESLLPCLDKIFRLANSIKSMSGCGPEAFPPAVDSRDPAGRIIP